MRVFCATSDTARGRIGKRRGGVPDERRVHRARAQHVDANVGAVVDGHLPDQGEQRALRGAVRRMVREPLEGGNRPANHHRSPAPRLHGRQSRPKQVEHRIQVDGHRLPPRVERHAGDRAEAEHPGEAGNRIDAAEQPAARFYQSLIGVGKAHITGHERGPAARGADLIHKRSPAVFVAAARHDGRALAREEEGRRAAHAAGGPGDDGGPALHSRHGGGKSTPRRPPRLENLGALTQKRPSFTRESAPGYPGIQMRQGQATLRRLRHPAAFVLLGVFLLAAQLSPVAHLATHRPDHTHGPRSKVFETAAHETAHRAGLPWAHDGANEGRPPGWRASSAAQRAHPSPDSEEAGHDHSRGEHRSHELPAGDHGRESIAHFGVALLEGPPAPIVAPPPQSIDPPPDARPRSFSVTSRPQLPPRGPPAPLSLSPTA